LIQSCEGVAATQYAIADPPPGVGSLMNKLQSAVIAYEKQNPAPVQTWYTDRTYHKEQEPYKEPYRERNQNRGYGETKTYGQAQGTRPLNRCFICNKEDCRSYKHPEKEQAEARAKLRA
jgi:hypothetical protein